MKKIDEFSSFTDEEAKSFDEYASLHGENIFVKEMQESLFKAIRDWAADEHDGDPEAENAKEAVCAILDENAPYSFVLIPESEDIEELENLADKCTAEKKFCISVSMEIPKYGIKSTESAFFVFVFDEKKCRDAGMVGVTYNGGHYLYPPDNTLYAPKMMFLKDKKAEA